MRSLFFLFILIPIAEIWVLLKVSDQIGALSTIGIVVFTAAVGVVLLRQQGLSTLMRARRRLQMSELPAQEVFEGVLIAVGGALLLTPGFITDTFGFACLVPVLRRWLISRLLPFIQVVASSPRGGPGRPQGSRGNTIDGEYRRRD